jgi:hypothetical protein
MSDDEELRRALVEAAADDGAGRERTREQEARLNGLWERREARARKAEAGRPILGNPGDARPNFARRGPLRRTAGSPVTRSRCREPWISSVR